MHLFRRMKLIPILRRAIPVIASKAATLNPQERERNIAETKTNIYVLDVIELVIRLLKSHIFQRLSYKGLAEFVDRTMELDLILA
ncbi:hypothetical protein N7490_009565 [Penicillium lividum]|nr:hypothetical protein N7490_009565 [Penicillium lividum]